MTTNNITSYEYNNEKEITNSKIENNSACLLDLCKIVTILDIITVGALIIVNLLKLILKYS
ncbi:hypothetical protein SKUN_00122 [Spiroplasma kunkelii CR2-3x]|uniref:Uncharacterized protein n=1 Tax=Spiroplasma kunkelii CR2-3x TaxID=273035 RepID=A0A0K2JFM4_SPIKU|nr:hypothetical protein [Spiroplasma kunkelii]ALA97046.1 hypothetical protein SKUN_00122 [Spiroplasma kunkelii CR2-3x]